MRAFYFNLKKIILFSIALPFLLTGLAQAGEVKTSPIAVLELFTSQGCSSCPVADKLLKKLGEREDIIALAYHVDYWDYIGWKDIFANSENSNLQRAYSSIQKTNHIYTPQLMINGTKDVVGSNTNAIDKILSNAKLFIPINIKYDDDYLEISISSNKELSEAIIWLVNIKSTREVEITRGENSGKVFTYSNIANERRALTMWNPKKGVNIKLPFTQILQEDDKGFAIILQEDFNGLPGRILGATSYFR